MSNSHTAADQLATLIEGIKKEAYQAGFDDALRGVRASIGTVRIADSTAAAKVVRVESPERKPPGHNKQVVIRVLSEVKSRRGLTQAMIIRHAAKRMNETLAQSSVRHALLQLKAMGLVSQKGTRWRRVLPKRETAGRSSQDQSAVSDNSSKGGVHAAA